MTAFALPPAAPARELIALDDGRTVDIAFYGGVYEQVEARLRTLDADVSYTAEMLCGEGFWSQLRPGQPSLAGRCLAHMVEAGVLPLQPVKSRHEYPKRYRRT